MFKDEQEEKFYGEAIQSFYSNTDPDCSFSKHMWKAGCDYTKEKLIEMGWTPPGEKQASQVEPVGVTIAPMMYKFLMGEGSIDGCWFGDRHSTLKGAFWWRSMLRHSAEAYTHPAPVVAQQDKKLEFGINGEKMFFETGVQRFTLDYEPELTEDFEFMKKALTDAISSITHGVKVASAVAQDELAAVIVLGGVDDGEFEENDIEWFGRFKDLDELQEDLVRTKSVSIELYARNSAPAVAQPPAEVVRELVEALEAWISLYGDEDYSLCPEVVQTQAALKSAKEHGL